MKEAVKKKLNLCFNSCKPFNFKESYLLSSKIKKNVLMKFAKRVFTLTLIALVSTLSCQSTQQMKQFPVNDKGYIELGKDAINKDAVRIQGIILTKGKKVADRFIYEMQVDEIVQLGATVSTVEPRQGERVELVTMNTIKLKRNSKIIIDAYTPQKRGDGILSIDMINI